MKYEDPITIEYGGENLIIFRLIAKCKKTSTQESGLSRLKHFKETMTDANTKLTSVIMNLNKGQVKIKTENQHVADLSLRLLFNIQLSEYNELSVL